eukprot:XP_001699741.1 predicted protein [Chlamydomonas reinhardtii]
MAEAAAEVAAEEEEQRHQQHSPAAAATAMSVRTSGLPGHASMAASVGGNSPRSPLDVSGRLVAFAAASAERGSAQLPTLSRISAGVSSRAHPDAESAAAAPSSAVRPTSSITLQPHPAPVHHQSHHQLNLPGHTGAQVAAERLKAKTRAYLARGSGGGSSRDSTAPSPDPAPQRSGQATVVVVPSTISDIHAAPAHSARAAGAAAPFRDSAGMELSFAELHLPLDNLLVQAQRLRIAEEEAEGQDVETEEVEEEEMPSSEDYKEGMERPKQHAGLAGVAVAAVASAAPALGDSSSELDDIIRQLHNLMGAAAAAKAVQLDRASKGGGVASPSRRSPQEQQAHEEEERRELAHLREVQQTARDEVAREQLERQQHLWEEEQEQSRRRVTWLQEERERQDREARAVAALQRFGDVGSPVRGVVQAYDTTAAGSVSLRLEEENTQQPLLYQQPAEGTAAHGGPQSTQWHAALAAKLLSPDAMQQRSSGGYQDAAVVLSEWKVPATFTAAEPRGTEPISIRRPFAWQERETRHWLEDLGLMVSHVEEAAPLLDNPLRNGLLLAALAVRLTGMPLPAGVLTDPPRDVRSARTNVLCAVDHLGLLAAPWWHWSVPLTKPVTKRREHG